MLLVLALAHALVGQSIPPPLPQPPTPEALAAAAALFPREPYTSENSWGISIAAAQVADEALNARGVNSKARNFALSDRLRDLAKQDQAKIIDEAIRCVAEPWARKLSIPDLEALKTFIATPSGRRFWMFHMQGEPWQFCFKEPVARSLAPVLDAEVRKVVAEQP
jgi:hypothetical protein